MDFPPIYVISLERARERREHMKQRLGDLGIPFVFVDAVDGKKLDPDSVEGYDKKRRAKWLGSTLTPNQLACALSHIGLFKQIADSEGPYSIVLEDDVVFEENFLSTLELIPDISLPWDHLRLGGLKKRKFVKRETLRNGVDVGYYTGPVWGAEGYALTPKGAEKLLNYKDLQLYIIDQAMERFWANGLESLGVHPFQLRQVEEAVLPSMIGYGASQEIANTRAQHRSIHRWFRRKSDVVLRRWHNLVHRGIFWDPPKSVFRNPNQPRHLNNPPA
jgi:glycosyl transferase family 25